MTDEPSDRAVIAQRLNRALHRAATGGMSDIDAALREVEALETAAGLADLRPLFDIARTGIRTIRGLRSGDASTPHDLPGEVARLAASLPPGIANLDQLLAPLIGAAEVLAASQGDDQARLWPAVDRFQATVDRLPPDHALRAAADEALARVRLLRANPSSEDVAALAATLGATDDDPVSTYLTLGMAALGGGEETALTRIDEGIGHFRHALALAPPEHPQHAFCLQSVALGLFRRSEVAGTVDGLAEAVDALERANDRLGGPDHPLWTFGHGMLADIHQRLAQFGPARAAGAAAQRRYAWRVLMRPNPAEARREIRQAAAEAVHLARRCLLENNAGGALTALDTGRGLILFAATELRRIGERLTQAGRDDLRRRWQESTGTDDGLRREVFEALSTHGATRLLEPPDLLDIQRALTTVDADALVYLLPADPPLTGAAIIAPADGPPRYLPLPNLTLQHEDVEGYVAALDNRDINLPVDEQFRDVASTLDHLLDWAWRAAVGPLLQSFGAGRPGAKPGRVPRLMLVPMGELARVPWSAARRRDGRYAVELAAFSQIGSARLLYDCASRPAVPLASVGLVVGDPDTRGRARDLVDARREADAVRRAFYPGARYLGRRLDGSVSPSGAGTAGEVRQWLTGSDPTGGAMLHLACHGSFQIGADDGRSFLLLAGREMDPDATLGAEEVVELMSRPAARELALIVLAACHTGRSVHGYDEAFSLATAFLAGGARSVLSTQWGVPDLETSSLMFMFHHFLRRDGRPAWDALRQAQLWMLDPQRVTPPDLPAGLRPRSPVANLAAWAGFVHWGQ